MKPTSTPLIAHTPQQILAWQRGRPISAALFWRDVQRVASALPEGRYLVNLCQDRYLFMLGFAAALQRGQVSLMPPNHTDGAINALLRTHAECHCLSDSPIDDLQSPPLSIDRLRQGPLPEEAAPPLAIAPHQPAAILFTSGSTGQPKPNPKRWDQLQQEAVSALRHFPFQRRGIRSLVATVPPQHMYGLATSILFPWQGGFAVDSGRPFFPADIADALSRLPAPRVLITTPLHLRACVAAGLPWPEIAFVISATAPLDPALARAAEEQLGTEIHEIYGSTETGSVAGRRTVREPRWHLYDGIELLPTQAGHRIAGGHVTEPVVLNDRIRLDDSGYFHLQGRDSDMVKIAGKRASLGDLTHRLVSIPGVEDGLFLAPPDESANSRLMALVVAPTLSKQELLEQLAHSVDAVFLPRPLYRVDRLPRNDTGKIPQAALQRLLTSLHNPS